MCNMEDKITTAVWWQMFCQVKVLWNRIYSAKKPLLCGTGVLLLSVILEKIGLIDRTGGNPFDKTTLKSGKMQFMMRNLEERGSNCISKILWFVPAILTVMIFPR